MTRGKFIVFEGIDGAGKTTLSKAVAQAIGAQWRCFPDRTTPAGKAIDGFLKESWGVRFFGRTVEEAQGHADAFPLLDAVVLQALMTVNRFEVIRDFENVLNTGTHIVCDRYWPSAYAYGKADGLDPKWLEEMHALLPKPDLYVLVSCSVETAAARVRARGVTAAERYDSRGPTFSAELETSYQRLVRRDTSRWVYVSTDGSQELALADALALIGGVP